MNNINDDFFLDVVKNIQKDAVPTSSQPQVDSGECTVSPIPIATVYLMLSQ